MRPKSYLTIGVASLIVFFALTPLGGYGGHHIKFLVAALIYCALTFWLLKRTSNKREMIIIIILLSLPPTMFDMSIRISHYEQTLMSFPSSLAHYIGILFGYLIFLSSRQIRIVLTIILFTGFCWVTFKGYSLWLHKLNFGTYSGNVLEKAPTFSLKNSSGKVFTKNELKNFITVFDFWNTGCGICFRKFPLLQDIYKKHRADSTVQLFAVNTPLKRDSTGQAENTLKKYGYTFTNLFAEDLSVADSFHIKGYPTTLVIDQRGNIVYRGEIDNVDRVIATLKKALR